MYGNPFIHEKLEQRPSDWNIERAPQIYDPEDVGLSKRIALMVGKWFIATGEKLVSTAQVSSQLNNQYNDCQSPQLN